VVLGGLVGFAPPAGAAACPLPVDALGSAKVAIDTPAPGEVVSGDLVVSGVAQSDAVGLDQVELLVGGKPVASRRLEAPASRVPFSFTVAAGDLPRGKVEVQVVACALFGLTASAVDDVTVTVQPAPPSTSPAASTTRPPASPPTTGATPEVAAPDAGAPQRAAPPTTTAQADPGVVGPLPVEAPASSAPEAAPDRERPLVLSEGQSSDTDESPLWVGLVVGLSGALGLVASAARRRAASRSDDDLDDDLYDDPDGDLEDDLGGDDDLGGGDPRPYPGVVTRDEATSGRGAGRGRGLRRRAPVEDLGPNPRRDVVEIL